MNDDLVIDDLAVVYPAGGYLVRAIDGLSATVPSGSLSLLLGPSGCGKTTLLSCVATLQTPTSGSIRFGATEITGLRGPALAQWRRRSVGIVFQSFNLVPSLSALENVMVPLLAAEVRPRDARHRAGELLERVHLGDQARQRPGTLSGGQQQRVAIARALALDPPLLLADEPTAHLDYVQVEIVLRLLRDLAEPGRVVLVATHDERMLPLADQVIAMAPRTEEERGRPLQVALAAGEVLFREGSRGDRIYVVDEGEVALVRTRADGVEVEIARAGAGEVFGELGPLFGLPRSAMARALSPTALTGYTVRQFRELPGGVARLAGLVGAKGADPGGDGAPPPGPATRRSARPRRTEPLRARPGPPR